MTIFSPAIRLHVRIPLLLGRTQALVEILEPLLEIRGIVRVKIRKLAGNPTCDPPPIVGIKPIVRIAQSGGRRPRRGLRCPAKCPGFQQIAMRPNSPEPPSGFLDFRFG